MTYDQFTSLARTVFKIVGSLMVARGLGDSAGWENIGNDALTVVGACIAAWGVYVSWVVHKA